MAALSAVQKKKILGVFNVLYDANKDGVIEKCDFDEAIKKINAIHQWPEGSSKYQEATDTLAMIWEGLKKFADENKDERVTQDEWLKMWGSCVSDVKGGKGFPDWQRRYMAFMFDANDTSGDGYIDQAEYTTIYTAFGVPEADCSKAFAKLSEGTDGRISREQFEELWTEYFISDDPKAKGNYLFGLPPL